MDTSEAIRTRRVARAYVERPVGLDDLKRIIDAGPAIAKRAPLHFRVLWLTMIPPLGQGLEPDDKFMPATAPVQRVGYDLEGEAFRSETLDPRTLLRQMCEQCSLHILSFANINPNHIENSVDSRRFRRIAHDRVAIPSKLAKAILGEGDFRR